MLFSIVINVINSVVLKTDIYVNVTKIRQRMLELFGQKLIVLTFFSDNMKYTLNKLLNCIKMLRFRVSNGHLFYHPILKLMEVLQEI